MSHSKQSLRAKEGISTGIVGLFVNLILVIIKVFAGIIANSVSILADAMNNLGDSAASILTIAGFYIAKKPADREHPFGHERAEYIAGLFTAIIILIVGIQFLITSVERILNPTNVNRSEIVLALLLLSMIIKTGLGLYYYRINKKLPTYSSALNALMKDSLFDTLINSVIMISYIIEINFDLYIDGYIGILVALITVYGGVTSIIEASNDLLGTRPNPELIYEMQDLLDSYDTIIGYHDLILHNYGPHKMFATVDIEIDSTWDLIQSHRVIDEIEYRYKKKFDIVLVCHIDPVALNDNEQNEVYRIIKRVLKSYGNDFHFHDFRIQQIKEKREIFFDVVVPDSCIFSNEDLRVQITFDINKELCEKFPINIEFDRNYVLREWQRLYKKELILI